jgi:hypothetical protein
MVSSRDSKSLRVGALLCLLIVVCARLSLPLAIEPVDVPLPSLDPVRHDAALRLEASRVARTRNEPLSRDVRAVGEFVRRLGTLEAESALPTTVQVGADSAASLDAVRASRQELATLQRDVSRWTRRLLAEGQMESLLALRALQAELFLTAVSLRDTRSPELTELGGSFARYLEQFPSALDGAEHAELAAAYRNRWSQLVGLGNEPSFAPSLDDVRQNARLQLRWAASLPPPEAANLTRKALEQLAAADTDYPAEFARGVAEFRAGGYAEAFGHFNNHMKAHPDGPWSLRAQNHAQAAAALMVHEE